ncbi:Fe-S cluster biogenesis protein NfuA [Lipingzhangella halophila]|uniref:Fe-S cluster biogenesis protein NfuA n=1 Tax=Lipingzhangella halophila TaxID=1783352 RepID=A0A7W7RP09_9ACTN|nr:NifU family protein [Lipingzhangella halophila]MBB4935018.1 Fe-S cluster biogenesis protein NfuA [Lipingzhangella halophila]
MTTDSNPGETTERVEHLLRELAKSDPAAHELAEEALGLIVELYGVALGRIVEYAGPATASAEAGDDHAGGISTLDHLLADDLVASLLVLHDLHPLDTSARIHQALERIRPYLGAHTGDVELVSVDAERGTAVLRLRGNCDNCPSSAETVRKSIEQLVAEAAPEIEEVRIEGVADPEAEYAEPDHIVLANGRPRPEEHAMACTVPGRLAGRTPAGD